MDSLGIKAKGAGERVKIKLWVSAGRGRGWEATWPRVKTSTKKAKESRRHKLLVSFFQILIQPFCTQSSASVWYETSVPERSDASVDESNSSPWGIYTPIRETNRSTERCQDQAGCNKSSKSHTDSKCSKQWLLLSSSVQPHPLIHLSAASSLCPNNCQEQSVTSLLTLTHG